MKKINLFSLLFLSAIALLVNCAKDGPAGATGPAGPVGPAGPQGSIGTANVIYSAWFTPTQNGGWTDTTINGVTLQKKFNKPAPGVTVNMLNTGVILTYVKLNPDGAGGTTVSIRQLPYANPGSAVTYFPLSYVGSISFAAISTSSPGVAVAAPSGGLEFRYVLIPGGTAGGRSSSAYTAEQLKNLSYEQIITLFNIPPDGSSR